MTAIAAGESMSFKARLAGAAYLLVFLAGGAAAISTSGLFVLTDAAATAANVAMHVQRFWLGFASYVVVILSYLVVTALFYELFRPVSGYLSMQAAFFSLVGWAVQAAALAFYAVPWVVISGSGYLAPFSQVQSQALVLLGLQLYVQAYNIGLAFFGCYCLLIGILVFRSTFVPRILGLLMMLGGLSWLTFVSPPLAATLRPFNLAPGVLGEASLTLWLLLAGVSARKWSAQANSH